MEGTLDPDVVAGRGWIRTLLMEGSDPDGNWIWKLLLEGLEGMPFGRDVVAGRQLEGTLLLIVPNDAVVVDCSKRCCCC